MGTESIVLILAIVAGFYMAWSIGANDVANAMGTSVASGALSFKQAVIIAGACNFLGAVFVGTHVTETIRKGVLNVTYFAQDPNLLIYGMLAVIFGAGIWVTTATYLGLPVSTTHAVVGAVIGFGLIGAGIGGIKWVVVAAIVLSWIISPLLGAFISYRVFTIIKKTILDSPNPLAAAKKVGPFFVGFVFGTLSLAIIFKGLKNLHLDLSFPLASGISIGIGISSALLSYFFLKRYPAIEDGKYDQVENLSKSLQIVSASYESFAHGANDVANAIGPIAAIIAIMETQKVSMEVPVPIWVLALGGIGLVIGISTWGYRVMETIGKKITEITPTRGFAAEFGTATTVLICSKLGMPVSTTHTSVGNVIGVGLARGFEALNFAIIGRIILSWLATLPVAAVLTILIYRLLVLLLG